MDPANDAIVAPPKAGRVFCLSLDETRKTAPYDALRRARHRELQHKDANGLRGLLDEYFSMADELEPGPPRRAA